MTADVRHRGSRSCVASTAKQYNAVLIDGGRTTRHCPPPSRIAIIATKI